MHCPLEPLLSDGHCWTVSQKVTFAKCFLFFFNTQLKRDRPSLGVYFSISNRSPLTFVIGVREFQKQSKCIFFVEQEPFLSGSISVRLVCPSFS